MKADRPRVSGHSATADLFLSRESDIDHASRALKAMAHPLRLKLLCLLGGAEEISVQKLVDIVGTSQSNVSQHLSILREKGILVSRKDANKVYYRIGDDKILQLMGMMREAFCGFE
ncbi:ArsR/SmtB family transcription factor [Pseudomonadota bacterium]